jgi:lipoprotein NlpD
MWRRAIPVLLAGSLVFAWFGPVLAAEFTSELEEYEFYSGTPQKKSAKIQPTVTYCVRKGDTVSSIARAHNISTDALVDANNLTGSLKAGSVLRVPCSGSAVKKRTAKKIVTKEVFAEVQSDGKFFWPVSGVRKVNSDAEKGVSPLGIVITGRAGSRVMSAAPGVVEKIGRMRGYGNFVVVRHADGIITVYAGLDTVSVRKGDSVRKGGEVGMLAADDGSLRFMVHRSGKAENPLKYLPKREG